MWLRTRPGSDAEVRPAPKSVPPTEWLDDAIITVALDGTILAWNRRAEWLYGYPADDVVGCHLSLVVARERRAELDGMLAKLRGGEVVSSHPTVHQGRNEMPIDVMLTVLPIRDVEGTPVGGSIIARDVTEQRWIASTLDSTLNSLETALEEARQAEARSRRFLADAAHQLRTPIASVQACAEALLHDPASENRGKLLAALGSETARATRLVTALFRMARLDEGEPLHPEPCDLVTLCQEAAERASVLAPHLAMRVEVPEPSDGPARLDTRAVREILASLLENARRYARKEILLRAKAGPDAVQIVVADDGPGLPPDGAERAFDRFVTLDPKGGSGLGLSISRGLARAHGGDVTYEDGAFVVRLARYPAEPDGDQVADGHDGR